MGRGSTARPHKISAVPLQILRGEEEIRIVTRNRRAVVRLRSHSRPYLCQARLILRLAPGSATRNLNFTSQVLPASVQVFEMAAYCLERRDESVKIGFGGQVCPDDNSILDNRHIGGDDQDCR